MKPHITEVLKEYRKELSREIRQIPVLEPLSDSAKQLLQEAHALDVFVWRHVDRCEHCSDVLATEVLNKCKP